MTANPPPALVASDIVAGYGDMQILHGVSLTVNSGEIVTILGPNGSGKSTMLRTLSGLLKARRGSVHVFGEDVTSASTRERLLAGLSYVPQVDNVFANLSTAENLRMGYNAFSGGYDEREARVLEALPQLRDYWKRAAGRLSGGQRQIVALGRALIVHPKVLMLDEPSAGLSPKIVDEVFATVHQIVETTSISVLLVEQNVQRALAISDRACVFAEGLKKLEAPADEILDNDEVGRIYLGREA